MQIKTQSDSSLADKQKTSWREAREMLVDQLGSYMQKSE